MAYSSGWRCTLCPHAEIPAAYLDALRNCRLRHDLGWAPKRARQLAESFYTYTPYLLQTIRGARDLKGRRILVNGGFESWSTPDGGTPEGWRVSESTASAVSRDEAVSKEGACSLRTAATEAVKHVYVIQTVPAAEYAGKTINFGVWCRSNFDSIGSVNVIDFIKTAGRADQGAGKLTRYRGEDGWWFITATKTIRQNAVGNIRFYLDSSLPADGVIHYDGAVAVARD